MIRVTIGSRTFTADSLEDLSPEAKALMFDAFQALQRDPNAPRPKVENLDAEPPASEPPPVALPSVLEDLLSPVPSAPTPKAYSVGWSDRSKDVVDSEAKARIEAQHTALRDAGVALGANPMGLVAGTRMMALGYENQRARKAEHDQAKPLIDAAHDIERLVGAEKRRDVLMTAGELASQITVNGKIHVAGHALTEAAIRGLAQRLESPMLGYVLGVRDRMGGAPKHELTQADKNMIAEVLRHECKRNPEAKLQLRTREAVGDVFAIVSHGYVEADATTILPEILRALPAETKATFAYDDVSTQWEIRASVWTPTPVDEQAIGEAFEGYVSLRSRDNGTSRFRGDGGVTLLACYNAGTYNAGGASVSRTHRGKVARDVAAMVHAASKSIHVLCKAWGTARQLEIPLTPEEKKEGDKFLAALWRDMLAEKPFVGVLSGRSAEHAKGLAYAYKSERRDRDADRLVVADMAQAWTKYIQGQDGASRRDAESAIGSWLVDGATLPGAFERRAVVR
jgi:hypothetical protein